MRKPRVKTTKPFIAWNYGGFPYLLLGQIGTSPVEKTEMRASRVGGEDVTYYYVPSYGSWFRSRLHFDAVTGSHLKVELEQLKAEHREALVTLNTLYKEMVCNAIIRAGGDPEQLEAFRPRKK